MGINQSAEKPISPPPSPLPSPSPSPLGLNVKGPGMAVPIPSPGHSFHPHPFPLSSPSPSPSSSSSHPIRDGGYGREYGREGGGYGREGGGKVSAFSPVSPPRGSEVNVLISPPGSPSTVGRMQGGPAPQLVPTVFTWSGGGKDVFITGAFNQWKEKIPLSLSERDFTLIQYLPPGNYQYKFIVDGKWVHAPDQPIQTDLKGNINNFLEVKPADQAEELASTPSTPQGSPPGAYSTIIPGPEFQKVPPPSLPPHLQRALLNIAPSTLDPTILPLPHHVMLNHFYSMENDNVTILGVTHRYRNKFVTTVLYKPQQQVDDFFDDNNKDADEFIEDIEL